jgi:hypothetical protein
MLQVGATGMEEEEEEEGGGGGGGGVIKVPLSILPAIFGTT